MNKISANALLNIPTVDTSILFHQLELNLFSKEHVNNLPMEGYLEIRTDCFEEFIISLFLYNIDSGVLNFKLPPPEGHVQGYVNVLKNKNLSQKVDSFFQGGNTYCLEKFILSFCEPFLHEYDPEFHQSLTFKIEVLKDYSPKNLIFPNDVPKIPESLFFELSEKIKPLILEYKQTSDLTNLLIFFIIEVSLLKKYIAVSKLKGILISKGSCKI